MLGGVDRDAVSFAIGNRRETPRVTPIFFDGRFGWLHDVAPGVAPGNPAHGARMGVILCAAFAQEEICTHYGLMLLADRLAAAGMPTLRFDYGGTGDSVDVDVALSGFEDDVARAVDVLRDRAGVGAVALCGLRLGAAVAARVAPRIERVAGVAMLAPVLTGQTFLRETRAAASVSSLAQLDPVPKADSDTPLNTNGFRWSGAFQREVAGIDLTAIAPPAPHVLLATIRSDRRAAALATALRDQGASVTERPFADYEAYVRDPTTHEMPLETFAAVEAWLGELPRGDDPVPARAPVTVCPTLVADTYEEAPMRFGPDVFGMLCRPVGMPAAPIAALLLHEGSSHHIGNGRAYVALARQLAGAGIASLRMDLTGMGDSPAGDNTRSPYFDLERQSEIRAAIDVLEGAGYPEAFALGLCSGADAAFQIGLVDPRIVGIVMVNLQKFVWRYGDDLRIVARNSKRTLKSYARSMRNPAEWRRALSGKADLVGIARVLTKRGVARGIHAVRGLMPPSPGSETARVRDQMRTLADRGVQTLLVFSADDTGLADVTMHFGRGGRRLNTFPLTRLIVFNHADHHFNGTDVRDRFHAFVAATLGDAVAARTRATR